MAKQSSNLSIVPVDPTYRNKVLAITGFAGLAFGIVAGLMLVRNIEKTGIKPQVSGREGLQLAMLLFGTMRSITNLWEE